MRHAPAVIHVGLANPRWRGKASRHSRCMHSQQFYVRARGPYATNLYKLLFLLLSVGEVNLALHRPAFQSNTYGDGSLYVAGKAVDGDALDPFSCSITAIGDFNPWWKVQLRYHVRVTHVEISSRRRHGLDMEWSERTSFDNI